MNLELPQLTPLFLIAVISFESRYSIGIEVRITANTNRAARESVPAEKTVIVPTELNPINETTIIPMRCLLGRAMTCNLTYS